MADEPRPSSFTRAVMCERCGETRLVERIGHEYFCQVCAHKWLVYGRAVASRDPA